MSIEAWGGPVGARPPILGEIIGAAADDDQGRAATAHQRLGLRRIAEEGADRVGHRVLVTVVRRRDETVRGPEDQRRAKVDRGEDRRRGQLVRSEEHTSELQSLMRISYAVFCLKK